MSVEYVDSIVDDRRRNPRPGARITVAVGVIGSMEEAVEEISALDPEVDVEKTLPYDSLRIELPEMVIDDLCSLAVVESVETEGRLRSHDSGN